VQIEVSAQEEMFHNGNRIEIENRFQASGACQQKKSITQMKSNIVKCFTLAIYSSLLMRCFILGIPSIFIPESVAISFAIARVVLKMPVE